MAFARTLKVLTSANAAQVRSISSDPTKEQCIQKFPLESQLALGIYLWMLIDVFSVCVGEGVLRA